ncbi:MAG: recombinase family protein [Candidatus Marinimicrobia bacterium]|jgi:DNA invertase Pin-like site-specific DNA recombinase|nr:recombinase family protein [Candidatus Neomarinimicrobiota bacterium]MBT7200762.1 recombinase family protein [Candidatus Neomarinimicrobiota bacterium]
MAKVGYARVSTQGQSLDVQVSKLTKYGCHEIFKDKLSGTTADRPSLKECRTYVRRGDSLVITKLDRLARSTFHLTQIAEELKQKGVDMVVLDQNIDTSTPTGKLLFNMLASIAEFETEIRKERQMEGITKAKEKGIQFGRKAKLTEEQVNELRTRRERGAKISDLMVRYSLSKASVYRLLAEP